MQHIFAGIIGTIIGGVATILVAFIAHRLTLQREIQKHRLELKRDQEGWAREKKETAYHNTVKYLARVLNIGPQTGKTDKINLGKDAPKEWFNDLAEASAWLISLMFYCSESQRDSIGETSTEMLNLSSRLIGFEPSGSLAKERFGDIIEKGVLDYQAFVDFIRGIESNIANAAIRDLRNENGAL